MNKVLRIGASSVKAWMFRNPVAVLLLPLNVRASANQIIAKDALANERTHARTHAPSSQSYYYWILQSDQPILCGNGSTLTTSTSKSTHEDVWKRFRGLPLSHVFGSEENTAVLCVFLVWPYVIGSRNFQFFKTIGRSWEVFV